MIFCDSMTKITQTNLYLLVHKILEKNIEGFMPSV